MKQIKNGGLWNSIGCLRYAESFSEPQSIRRRARQVAVLIIPGITELEKFGIQINFFIHVYIFYNY